MSSTTTRPGTDASGRSATDRRGLWAVLRVHRSAMWIWIAFVVIGTVAMLWLRYGPYGTGAVEFQENCGTRGFRGCDELPLDGSEADPLFDFWFTFDYVATALRNLAPIVAGWAGGALIARELENGTAELAWTQAITPTRWLMEKLAVPTVFLTVGAGILILHFRTLLHWADAHDMLTAGYEIQDYYFTYGPSTVAYVLLGLAVGVLAGFLTRSMLPALAIAGLVTWTVSWILNPWRTQIWPVVTRTHKGEGPFGFAALRCQWDQSDHKYSVDACLGAKPASLYWPVQLVETGFVLLLAALAVAAAYWLLRRRTP
ncbi:ABC transporter permease [Streptomyces albidus (ex Kaewkla and Franco 2022)]|uniref:ABC transporter permease n=1 Tax=Streptomyces albidus (ex Kaewkla and Franco 2022) TaxID=722709 RepID=UPI0015EF4D66|nr:ABC transporter permease [Streptomyces albidus (ex Kaewkla and Franco 2022)]